MSEPVSLALSLPITPENLRRPYVGSAYARAADDLGIDYDLKGHDNPNPCAFCWDPPPPGDPVTADDGLTTGEKVGIGASIVAGIGVVACIIAEPCGAAALAALGLTGGAVLVTQ